MVLYLVRLNIWTANFLEIAYDLNLLYYYYFYFYFFGHQTGVAYSKHMMQLYTYHGNDIRQHLEVSSVFFSLAIYLSSFVSNTLSKKQNLISRLMLMLVV